MVRSKARLTITLSPDLLERIDALIDGKTLRNRSNAIETLVRKALTPTVTTAVILAGGEQQGEHNPALTMIDGQELIRRTVSHLMRFGVRNFVIVAGTEAAHIEAVMGDGSKLGASIRYVVEIRPLGTAGALRAASPYLDSGSFLVVHGDVLTNIDLASFIDFHASENSLATIAVKPKRAERTYGKVLLQGNRITDFRADGQADGISIINTGVYLFQREVLSLIDDDGPSMLESDVFPALADMGELSAFFFQGLWFDVRTPENKRLAETRWKQKGRADAPN